MPPDKPATILFYALAAAAGAIALVYIFGPSLFPDDENLRNATQTGAVGLTNPANDCFINSVLQALTGLKNLRLYLSKNSSVTRDGSHGGEPGGLEKTRLDPSALSRQERLEFGIVTRALEDVLDALSQRPTYRKTISAKGFVRVLEYAYGRMINRRQQDAQEFLQLVVERIADEDRFRRKLMQQSLNLADEEELDETEHHEKDREANQNVTVTPFEGCTTSQIECLTCHYKPKQTTNTFAMLSLSVPQTSSTTLDACLDGLLKQETIDGYRCSRCVGLFALEYWHGGMSRGQSPPSDDIRTALERVELAVSSNNSLVEDEDISDVLPTSLSPPTRRISRHTYISTYPNILTIHLSRSVFDVSSLSLKNNAQVLFPELLTLGGFEPRKFRLVCLITHRGGHDSGHYETFRRKGQEEKESDSRNSEKRRRRKERDRWWRISDERIAECTTEDVLAMQKEAYLLFYESIDER